MPHNPGVGEFEILRAFDIRVLEVDRLGVSGFFLAKYALLVVDAALTRHQQRVIACKVLGALSESRT